MENKEKKIKELNLPITNNKNWRFTNNSELFLICDINNFKENFLINTFGNTVHYFLKKVNVEGILIQFKGNPFNIKNKKIYK